VAHPARVYDYWLGGKDETAQFFAGLNLVEPGVAGVSAWRPDSERHA